MKLLLTFYKFQIKYGRIENLRHEKEVNLHKAWLDKKLIGNGNTASQISVLDIKIEEYDKKMKEFLSILKSGDSHRARDFLSNLDNIREGKKEILNDLWVISKTQNSTVNYEWNF